MAPRLRFAQQTFHFSSNASRVPLQPRSRRAVQLGGYDTRKAGCEVLLK